MNHFPSQLPTASPSVLESEVPPPSSAATDVSDSAKHFPSRLMFLCQPILGSPTSDSPLENVKTRPAKQQGCEEYESLSRLEKIEVHLYYPFKFYLLSVPSVTSTVLISCFRKPFGRSCYGALASVPRYNFSLRMKKRNCIKKVKHC
jgi:hypothetical protein